MLLDPKAATSRTHYNTDFGFVLVEQDGEDVSVEAYTIVGLGRYELAVSISALASDDIEEILAEHEDDLDIGRRTKKILDQA